MDSCLGIKNIYICDNGNCCDLCSVKLMYACLYCILYILYILKITEIYCDMFSELKWVDIKRSENWPTVLIQVWVLSERGSGSDP